MSAPIARQAQYWLLVTSLCVVAPLLPELPLWISVSTLLLLAWHGVRVRLALSAPPRLLAIGLAVGGIWLIVRSHGTFMGRDAGTALLVLLLGLKFLELRTHRDAMLVALLLCVLLATNLLYAQALWLAAFIFIASAMVAASLYALTQAQQRLGTQMKFAGALVAAAFPLALLLHVLFPRIEGALWRLPAAGNTGVTGMSETMRPGSVAAVSESDTVVLRAQFAGAPPAPAQRYWRTLVLWHTDGTTWSRGGPQQLSSSFIPQSAPLDYTLSLEPSGERWLPALDVPAQVPAGARALPGLVLEQLQPGQNRTRYSLRAYPDYRSGDLSLQERAHALQQPPLSPRVRALAQGWRTQSAAAPEIVAQALRFFSAENFYYSLQPPLLGADPVDAFLFDTRTGFCEHFAGAFVTLMRAAGVPARVVLGYQGGEYNAAGDYLIVREYDAHAWAEVWLATQGWTRVDPTAAVAPERISYGSLAIRRLLARGGVPGHTDGQRLAGLLRLDAFERALRSARWFWDASNNAWNHWVADYAAVQQRQVFAALGIEGWSRSALAVLLAALVMATLAVYARALLPRGTQDPLQRLYARFTDKLARVGLARAPTEGPRDYAARCARLRPDLRAPIEAISELYIDARYGQGATPARINDLRRLLRHFRPRLLTQTKAGKNPAE